MKRHFSTYLMTILMLVVLCLTPAAFAQDANPAYDVRFAGVIDEARVWGRALSEAEIRARLLARFGKEAPVEPELEQRFPIRRSDENLRHAPVRVRADHEIHLGIFGLHG